jgi:hypothetical protein
MAIPDFRDDGRLPDGGDIAAVELEMMVLTEGMHGEI